MSKNDNQIKKHVQATVTSHYTETFIWRKKITPAKTEVNIGKQGIQEVRIVSAPLMIIHLFPRVSNVN